MIDQLTRWKVAFVGPTGAILDGSAFKLLYSFATRKQAEEHAESFRLTGMKCRLVTPSCQVVGQFEPDGARLICQST
jgi:hypothetical protein